MEVQRRPIASTDPIKGSLAHLGHQAERFFSRVDVAENGCWEKSWVHV